MPPMPITLVIGQVKPLRHEERHSWKIALKYSPKIQNKICSEKCVSEKIVLRMFTAILEELYSFIMSVFIAWKHGNITDQHVNIITQQKVYWKVGGEFKEKGVLSSCIKKEEKFVESWLFYVGQISIKKYLQKQDLLNKEVKFLYISLKMKLSPLIIRIMG